jgi:serine/threonine protein kinase
MEAWQVDHYKCWFDTIAKEEYNYKVKQYAMEFPDLVFVKDADGRVAQNVAHPVNGLMMKSLRMIHGRYSLVESIPDHISQTCVVFRAIDELYQDEDAITGLLIPRRVALKIMRKKEHFLREVTVRNNHNFDSDAVIGITDTYPSLDDPNLPNKDDILDTKEFDIRAGGGMSGLTKESIESHFILVLPYGEKNMFVAMKQERFAGKEFSNNIHIFKQLVHAVRNMHEKGVLHADLKPLNMVRVDGKWRLIDLDAACLMGEPIGHKSSSAYVPPEAIYFDQSLNLYCVKSPNLTSDSSQVLLADPSFDIWSLGVLLFQLCNDQVLPLFEGGRDDSIDQPSMHTLFEWSDDYKSSKMKSINDPIACNLISQMLHKDPSNRPTIQQILNHPFLTGNKGVRMKGTVLILHRIL